MKIGVIGLGRVGTAARDLFKAHEVVCWDKKMQGERDYPRVQLEQCDFAVVAVDTPESKSGDADTSFVVEAIKSLPTQRLLLKSTVPPGFTEGLAAMTGKEICFWPEYIGESAYQNPYFPDRIEDVPFVIVGGVAPLRSYFIDRLSTVLGPTKIYYQCTSREAELIKYMENAYFASKIVFVNEWRRICETFDADWHTVREGWLLDPRVERMHTLSFADQRGFGGRCLPKDLSAIVAASDTAGYSPDFLKSVAANNLRLQSAD